MDVKSERLYPFVCMHKATMDEVSANEVCSGCFAFVSLLNEKFTPHLVMPYFKSLCKSKVSLVLNDIDDICVSASRLLVHLMDGIKLEYLSNFKICNLLQNCDLSKKLPSKGKCSNCKFILEQLKMVMIDMNQNQSLKNNSLTLKLALQFVCEGLNLECNDFNFISLMKKVSSHYFTENNIEMICVAFNQC